MHSFCSVRRTQRQIALQLQAADPADPKSPDKEKNLDKNKRGFRLPEPVGVSLYAI